MSTRFRSADTRSSRVRVLVSLAVLAGLWSGCAFRQLARELRLMEESYLLTGMIVNAVDYDDTVWVVVLEREADGRVVSADATRARGLGVFAFMVDGDENRYVAAFADENASNSYNVGEPVWIHTNSKGEPAPVEFLPELKKARVVGSLSRERTLPSDLIEAGRAFQQGRPLEDVLNKWDIPITLGEVVSLDDPRFSEMHGSTGLWMPASFAMELGIGIFFLEEYDPKRIPVLFVYGAGGSPQNWRAFFERIDHQRYQAWFFLYPTGRHLDEMAEALHRGVSLLQEYYRFQHLHIIAHSMGGLVTRSFLIKNAFEASDDYVDAFVTISTPWAGHRAAQMGVDRAPAVVPSWRDMAPGSEFLQNLFAHSLNGEVDHHLLFGYRGSRSMVLPQSNDGVVSVASQLAPEAQTDAARLYGFDLDHAGILSDPNVIATVYRILDGYE